jgi:hypothetical protein
MINMKTQSKRTSRSQYREDEEPNALNQQIPKHPLSIGLMAAIGLVAVLYGTSWLLDAGTKTTVSYKKLQKALREEL